ncbi:MAG: peptidase U32 family protein [Coprococcus sp.]
MREIEVLAPAGSFDTMKAAYKAGADAVYMGGPMFGARAYADNADAGQMLSAIDYAHLHGRKLYMTVNTLLKNTEIEGQLEDYIRPFYEQGLDAVIVQDLGVMEMIHTLFPDMAIHASTQMTVCGTDYGKWLRDHGASRIVTPRELDLSEIADMKQQTGVEIETFVHGALCYCYSGQCLMSSMIGGRSGNRGRCAQPCRLPWTFRSDSREKSGYLLSPKDLCSLQLLPDLIDAGVDSLKIEGRMKKPEYAALTAYLYRKYTAPISDRRA